MHTYIHYTYMYVATINEKREDEFEREHAVLYVSVWREERERKNDIIML